MEQILKNKDKRGVITYKVLINYCVVLRGDNNNG